MNGINEGLNEFDDLLDFFEGYFDKVTSFYKNSDKPDDTVMETSNKKQYLNLSYVQSRFKPKNFVHLEKYLANALRVKKLNKRLKIVIFEVISDVIQSEQNCWIEKISFVEKRSTQCINKRVYELKDSIINLFNSDKGEIIKHMIIDRYNILAKK